MSKDITNLTELFGSYVFSDAVMRERLPKATYKELKKTMDDGKLLNLSVAEIVASVMKDWAIDKGATHYTHWFQPMTGITAEKHDSFISPTDDGKIILEFSGKELIKGEPDASSFPSGGLRATFEARGYTAWDCTSPAFVKEKTLYIPTAFCSYTGFALDKKTPLLRSMEALSKQALRVLKLFGSTATKVVSTVGAEQEYFLIDKDVFYNRKDLLYTGRTLFGMKPPKGQEMEDQYFTSLKERISAFMHELDIELWKVGVAAKTKHNEVAPSQHELAPVFTTTNIAADNNQLTMELMKKIALRHDLVCLLHEKPFAGVNGSGKHNNWSISTNEGQNLLDPGLTPHDNAQFLVFLTAVIKAVNEYSDLLRVSAANAGNDHRLGANEAPPAIISIFLGEQLTEVLEQIEHGSAKSSKLGGDLTIGVSTLPSLPKDTTDRNRTSPFAFTGNKFEFRMVASSASISAANFTLNTIVAETLCQMADRLEKAVDFNAEVQNIIKEIATNHKKVIFNGNNYSAEWISEAEKRGLPNIRSTVEATKAIIAEKNVKILEKHSVLSKEELESRFEIILEQYTTTINIEALTMLQMAKNEILPACINFSEIVANSINSINATGINVELTAQKDLLVSVVSLINKLSTRITTLEKAIEESASVEDTFDRASAYRDKVFVKMSELREIADKLEEIVDNEIWPYDSYGDILFKV